MKHGSATAKLRTRTRSAVLKSLVVGVLGLVALHAAGQPTVAPAYVDRVLESGAQTETLPENAEPDFDSTGWARSLRLDYALSSQRGPSSSLSRAIAFSGVLDTPAHGALSLVGTLNSQRVDGFPGERGTSNANSWRIDQRAMPLNGGWMADHSAGDVSTSTPPMARGLGRIFLPITPIAGAAGRWYSPAGIDLNASHGNAGLFTGIDVYGFTRSGGQVTSAGGQMRLSGPGNPLSRTDAALQMVDARDVPEAGAPSGLNTSALWGALSWEGAAPWGPGLARTQAEPIAQRRGGLRLQGNWMQSSSSPSGHSIGAWVDGAWRTDWLQNTAGIFYLEPNLRWGAINAASDLKGAYWRAETSARRWQLGWSLEGSASVSGLGGRSAFASMYGRYSLDTRNTLGSTVTMRAGNGAAHSVQLSWDHNSDWGQTQWRGNLMRSGGIRTIMGAVDQVWSLGIPMTLATSVGWEQSNSASARSSAWSWGLLGAYSPSTRFSVDASLRGARGDISDSLSANVGIAWRYNPQWSFIARYTEARGQDPQSAQIVSALTAASLLPPIPVVASRNIQVILRYEARAGTVTAPLGGVPGMGAGALKGTVFFDADNNGRREASEAGVPNITVILDRRFVARTDAQGRYEFPWVVAGEHSLQIQTDNVPLPWNPVVRAPVPASVLVRSTTNTDFALQRDR